MNMFLQGGLGNQIFQAAFAFSVARPRREDEVCFDVSSFKNDPLRHYQLDAYNLDMKFKEQIGYVFQERNAKYDYCVYITLAKNFRGYFQNEKYFDKELVYDLFRMPKGQPNDKCLEMARRIRAAKESCFIGIRRADYLWPERINYHGIMAVDYYYQALKRLLYPGAFVESFVFTDDLSWAREHFECPIVDVNGPDEKHWDIWLMSLCKNAIIANSTFHWWGAWLGADKNGGTIVAPRKWFADPKVNEQCSIVPDRWQVI